MPSSKLPVSTSRHSPTRQIPSVVVHNCASKLPSAQTNDHKSSKIISYTRIPSVSKLPSRKNVKPREKLVSNSKLSKLSELFRRSHKIPKIQNAQYLSTEILECSAVQLLYGPTVQPDIREHHCVYYSVKIEEPAVTQTAISIIDNDSIASYIERFTAPVNIHSVAFKIYIAPKIELPRMARPLEILTGTQEQPCTDLEEVVTLNPMPDVIPHQTDLKQAISAYSAKIVNSFAQEERTSNNNRVIPTKLTEYYFLENESLNYGNYHNNSPRKISWPTESVSSSKVEKLRHLSSKYLMDKDLMKTERRDSLDDVIFGNSFAPVCCSSPSPVISSPVSKIGRPRILSRPQESPPRSRKFPSTPSASNSSKALAKQALSKATRLRLSMSLIQSKPEVDQRISHYSPRPVKPRVLLSPPLEYADTRHLTESVMKTKAITRAHEVLCRAQKLSENRLRLPSRDKMSSDPHIERHRGGDRRRRKGSTDTVTYETDYASTLRIGLPAAPKLTDLRIPETAQQQTHSQLSKVSVALRLKPSLSESIHPYITVNSENQVVVRDPAGQETNMAPSCRRQFASIPKLFVFDHVFPQHAQQSDVCQKSIWEIVQSVMEGSDGCVLSFGQAKTGKTRSMLGTDESCSEFGVIPTSISWLFHLISQRQSTTRVSVRMSVLQIRGRDESLHDLLIAAANPVVGNAVSPALALKDSRVYGTQIENLTELRVQDVHQAGIFLDAALHRAAQLNDSSTEVERGVHSIFTFDIYQHRMDKPNTRNGGTVAGGRSRLHLIDIGACVRSNPNASGKALSLAALGSTIKSLLNGQRHFPYKESILASLLKESLGNAACRTCILVHASTQPSQYAETLQIIQLAASIHRMKIRRKNKFSSNSSDGSASTNSRLRRRGIKMGTSTSYSDPDVSSSEQSVDTVIFVEKSASRQATDPYCSPGNNRIINYSRSQSHQPVQSPYQHAGPIKSRSSEDETSSEGRRRMPRTNPRVGLSKKVSNSPTLKSTPEHWVDAPPHSTGFQPHVNNPYQQVQGAPNPYMPLGLHNQRIPPPWASLGHYNQSNMIPHTIGQPITHMVQQPANQKSGIEPQSVHPQYGHPQTHNSSHQNGQTYPDSSVQEFWIDGPSAFDSSKPVECCRSPHTSPSRKPSNRCRHKNSMKKGSHRDSPRHHRSCTKCGHDSEPSATEVKHKDSDEALHIVKPFVKDWVIRHSSMTPSKRNKQPKPETEEPTNQEKIERRELVDLEIDQQDLMQLTVDLQQIDGDDDDDDDELCRLEADGVVSPVSHTSIKPDDSASQVTEDSRVGYESKEGSIMTGDDRSSMGEIPEMCEAACQTDFTDWETQSTEGQSKPNSLENILLEDTFSDPVVDLPHPESVHASLLRRPDGASDPNLHKEIADKIEPLPTVEPKSSTLPRIIPTSRPIDANTSCSPSLTRRAAIPLPKQHSLPAQPVAATSPQTEHVPDKPAEPTKQIWTTKQGKPKTENSSKLKPPTPVRRTQEAVEIKPSVTTPTKKPKSRLQSFLSYGKKDKESSKPKTPQSPVSSKKSIEPSESRKDRLASKSQLKCSKLREPSSSIKCSPGNTEKVIPHPAQLPTPTHNKKFTFDPKSSPYRRYVLPRPSYAIPSDCSDLSSCPSTAAIVFTKKPTAYNSGCGTSSSGYESMVAHSSAEDGSTFSDGPLLPTNVRQPATDPSQSDSTWVNASSLFKKLTNNNNDAGDCDSNHKLREIYSQKAELDAHIYNQSKIEQLLYQQEQLKKEMAQAKATLMIQTSDWSYDLHVATQRSAQTKGDNSAYVEALQKETEILQRRVDACKSRIMMVTSIL